MNLDSPLMINSVFSPSRYYSPGEVKVVYPIACPALRDLAKYALSATTDSENVLCQGLNGEVFNVDSRCFNVVKKLFPAGQANNFQPTRERKALVALEANDIISGNIQAGLLAFETRDGDVCIISTKIKGKKPHPITNKFTPENMQEMVDTLAYLDKPGRYWNHKKPWSNPAISLPMHYDLKPGNILVNKNNFGVIDFEYLDFVKLFSGIKKGKEHLGILCNYSDNAEVPSNLRNMEYRALLPYIEKLDNVEAQELFLKYLKIKSVYHKKMAASYKAILPKLPLFSIASIFTKKLSDKKTAKKIIESEIAHSLVLSKPSKDIVKSEAMKIQIARYIYLLSTHSHGEKTEINLEQVKDYILDAERFFEEKENMTNGYTRTYYTDNKNLIRLWKRIIPVISNAETKSKLDYYKDISGVANDSEAEEVLHKTIYTQERQKTFDEKVI